MSQMGFFALGLLGIGLIAVGIRQYAAAAIIFALAIIFTFIELA